MSPDPDSKLGRAIRARRQELGISIRVLAEKSQVNKGFLSRIETGQAMPGTATLMALAPVLELSVSELVGETPPNRELPELQIYLRAKYDLSDNAIADVADYLQREYGTEPGPLNGEDEDENTTD